MLQTFIPFWITQWPLTIIEYNSWVSYIGISNVSYNNGERQVLAFNNYSKLKYMHDLVVGVGWSMTEFVMVVVHIVIRNLNTQTKSFAVHPFYVFSKATYEILVKSNHVHCGVLAMKTWYELSSLKTMFMITQCHGYEMNVTWTT